ncbi:hypothetical protein [Sedimentitalea sp.]|uniref:hypothetical protein n=1 Tax=Sedimentitalea sp. TaxID=2048915 RepID=UPI003297FD67
MKEKLLHWTLNGVLPGLVVAGLLAILVSSFGFFESWVKRSALDAFPAGTLVLVSKTTKSCPLGWELLGEVSILGWNPEEEDAKAFGSLGGTSLDEFGQRRDADKWGYAFDYFRFFACGKT